MFRIVDDPANLRQAVVAASGRQVEAREVLFTPAIRLTPFDGLPTTVVAFTTDIPFFEGASGQPFLIGPGSIHVAHTSEEYIPKKQLVEAVQIYSRLVKKLLEKGNCVRMTKGLAIVGNGKMGKLVDALAPGFDFDVRARFDARNNDHAVGLTREALQHVDVAIEFSTPESAPQNLLRLASLGIPTVTGTTGWYDHLPAVRDAVLKGNTSLVWGPNFSIGMNLFMQLVTQAAALFAKHPDYDAWGWEIHHAAKKDALSGTLRKLAEEMPRGRLFAPSELSPPMVPALIPATPQIGFDSAGDTAFLRHTARNREGFARGAPARRRVGHRQQRRVRISRNTRGAQLTRLPLPRVAAFHRELRRFYVYWMGTAMVTPFRPDGSGMKRPCACWCSVRSTRASISWFPAAPLAKAPHSRTKNIFVSSRSPSNWLKVA